MTDYTHKRKHYNTKTKYRMAQVENRMILISPAEIKRLHERYQRKYGRPTKFQLGR